MNQYSQNPKHTQALEVNQARHCANCVTKLLKPNNEMKEAQTYYYLSKIYDDCAILIPEPILQRWMDNLNPRTKEQVKNLITSPSLPFASDGQGRYRKNYEYINAGIALVKFTQSLYLNGCIENEAVVKAHEALLRLEANGLKMINKKVRARTRKLDMWGVAPL